MQPVIVPIDEASDPRIELYRAVRERDLAGRSRRFLAEGEVVLRVLLTASRLQVESILLSEKRLAAVSEILAAVSQAVPVYVTSQAIMSEIVGFPIHRGVLALGRREKPHAPTDLLCRAGSRSIVVGLIGLANHDNVGGVFRNAAAFGAGGVLLDDASCDPLYRKAIRVSVGASLIVPFARAGSPDAMLQLLSGAGFETVALTPRGLEPLTELKPARKTALLLGSEGTGLPCTILDRVRTVRIPMTPGFDSLNVATASGIALHHLAARRSALALPDGAG